MFILLIYLGMSSESQNWETSRDNRGQEMALQARPLLAND
jgi:hypothetical protein